MRGWISLPTLLLAVLPIGCATPPVGAPCLPEQVPENGFDGRESYIETASLQCETRVCVVHKLRGDPREPCTPTATRECAARAAIEDSVYCSCRCDSDGVSDSDCECPAGFSCDELLDHRDQGVKGRYCIKKRAVSAGP
jgi:hypothetical protein